MLAVKTEDAQHLGEHKSVLWENFLLPLQHGLTHLSATERTVV